MRVGMADQAHVFYILYSHHRFDASRIIMAAEANARGNLRLQFRFGHIGLPPAIPGYAAFVFLSRRIDNEQHLICFALTAELNHVT